MVLSYVNSAADYLIVPNPGVIGAPEGWEKDPSQIVRKSLNPRIKGFYASGVTQTNPSAIVIQFLSALPTGGNEKNTVNADDYLAWQAMVTPQQDTGFNFGDDLGLMIRPPFSKLIHVRMFAVNAPDPSTSFTLSIAIAWS